MTDPKDQMIIDAILETKENLLAAFECDRVFTQAKMKLTCKLLERVSGAMAKSQELRIFTCKTDYLSYDEKEASPLACYDNSRKGLNISLRIQTVFSRLRGMRIGVCWDAGHKNENPDLAKKMFTFFNNKINEFREFSHIFGAGKTDDWWLWYSEFRPPWNDWNNIQVLQALHGNEFTEPEQVMLELCGAYVKFWASHQTT